jgi:subtilisin family serine protease
MVWAGPAGTPVRTYVHLPYVAVRASGADVAASLARLPGVRRVHPPGFHRALSDDAALALVGQPAAVQRGVTGEGTAVAVIDTGADYTHPDHGG